MSIKINSKSWRLGSRKRAATQDDDGWSGDGIADGLDDTESYDKGELIVIDNKMYKANADIPKGTVFVEGLSGQTWSSISGGRSPVHHLSSGNYSLLPKDHRKEFHIEDTISILSIDALLQEDGISITILNTTGTASSVAFSNFTGVFKRQGDLAVDESANTVLVIDANTSYRITITKNTVSDTVTEYFLNYIIEGSEGAAVNTATSVTTVNTQGVLYLSGDVNIDSSWRIVNHEHDNSMHFERRENGAWLEKGSFSDSIHSDSGHFSNMYMVEAPSHFEGDHSATRPSDFVIGDNGKIPIIQSNKSDEHNRSQMVWSTVALESNWRGKYSDHRLYDVNDTIHIGDQYYINTDAVTVEEAFNINKWEEAGRNFKDDDSYLAGSIIYVGRLWYRNDVDIAAGTWSETNRTPLGEYVSDVIKISISHWVAVGINELTGDMSAWQPDGTYRSIVLMPSSLRLDDTGYIVKYQDYDRQFYITGTGVLSIDNTNDILSDGFKITITNLHTEASDIPFINFDKVYEVDSVTSTDISASGTIRLPLNSTLKISISKTNTETIMYYRVVSTGTGNASGSSMDTYSNSSTYLVGDFVIEEFKLYRNKTPILTGEEFTGGKWDEISPSTTGSAMPVAGTNGAPSGNTISTVADGLTYSSLAGRNTVDALITALFPATTEPQILPTVTITAPVSSISTYVGEDETFNLEWLFNQGDGGALVNTTLQTPSGTNNAVSPESVNLAGIVEGISSIVISAEYSEGTVPDDSYGNPDVSSQIQSGTAVKTFIVNARWGTHYGLINKDTVIVDGTSAQNRALSDGFSLTDSHPLKLTFGPFTLPLTNDYFIAVPGNYTSINILSGGFMVNIGERIHTSWVVDDYNSGASGTTKAYTVFVINGQADDSQIDSVTIT